MQAKLNLRKNKQNKKKPQTKPCIAVWVSVAVIQRAANHPELR